MLDNRRYYSLDALRGSMMMLGILLHGSQWYVAEPIGGIPLPSDESTSYVFNLVVYFIHSFRMPLFFILAGFFTSLLVDKRDIKGTYINRGKRILLPLLVGIFTILPLTILFMGAFMVSARFNVHQFIPQLEQIEIIRQEIAAVGIPVDQPSFGHLWFLYYLLYFYLCIPLCVALMTWCKPWQQKLNQWLARPITFLLLCAITALSLWPFKGGQVFDGFIFITPHAPSLLYYGGFFILGYFIHHHRQILHSFSQYLALFASLSLVLFPLSIYASYLELSNPSLNTHLLAVSLHAACTWALIYTFMGLFLRYLDYNSPWILYISQSSYWVYLIHMPMVALAAWWLLPYQIPAYLKFFMVVGFAISTSLLSYHYLIQNSWVSQLLSGMRFNEKWPWQKPKTMVT